MRQDAKDLYQVVQALRAGFQSLKGLADRSHRADGVSASMRAVLECLSAQGPDPVPAIARKKGVSRQHIQVTVDALLEDGLVELLDNPAHKRSPIVALSAKGEALFADIQTREVEILNALAARLPMQDVETVTAFLTRLRNVVETYDGEGAP